MSGVDGQAFVATESQPVHRGALLRWQIGYGTFGVPQAAAPIAFALLALPLTGSAESGAAMVLAMTAAQVLGAAPFSRLGARLNPVVYLRILIAFRTLASLGLLVIAWAGGSLVLLVAAAGVVGLVNGAAYGYQRTVLNYLVPTSSLPRALGVAATLNEVTFAASPIIAAAVGALSPLAGLLLITVLGMGPMLLMTSIPQATPLPAAKASKLRARLPV